MREHYGETSDNWPDVVVVSRDGHWRIARSSDRKPATQWLVQTRSGGEWRSKLFFQDGGALQYYCDQAQTRSEAPSARSGPYDGCFLDPAVKTAVATLPAHCPQR